MTEALAQSLGASAAFFLIADLSGRALVRMSHGASDDQLAGQGLGGPEAGARLDDGDQAVVVNVDDGPVATALRTQTVQVLPPLPGDAPGEAARWIVLAPVTERGEALGLLQLSLPTAPDASVLAQIARIGHLLAFVVIANRRHTDLFEWAQRSTVVLAARRDPAPAAPGRVHLRGRCVHAVGVAGAGGIGRWRHLRLLPGTRRAPPVADRRDGPWRGQRAHGHPVRGKPAQHPAPGWLLPGPGSRGQPGRVRARGCQRGRALRHRHAGTARPDAAACSPWSTPDTSRPTCAVTGPPPLDLPVDFPWVCSATPDTASTDIALDPGDRLVMVTDGMLERDAADLDLVTAINQTRTLHPREAPGPDRPGGAARRRGPGRRCHPHGPGLARRAREPPADDRGCRAMAHQPDRPTAGPSRSLRALRSDRWVRAARPCAGTPAPVRGR